VPADLRIVEEPFDGPGAAELVPGYVAEIQSLYPQWSPDVPPRLTAQDVEPPGGRWLVAYVDQLPVGCGALKRLDDMSAEIKRLFVTPEYRGSGVARALMTRLEEVAAAAGYLTIRLDTGPSQPASRALFSSSGYTPIPDYNGNPVAAHWFEKVLDPGHDSV
jgi:GNAT superfamily N-acetyltransferase